MPKFATGLATGWIAARALPPPTKDDNRLKPPTADELYTLAQKLKKAADNIMQKFDNGSTS